MLSSRLMLEIVELPNLPLRTLAVSSDLAEELRELLPTLKFRLEEGLEGDTVYVSSDVFLSLDAWCDAIAEQEESAQGDDEEELFYDVDDEDLPGLKSA